VTAPATDLGRLAGRARWRASRVRDRTAAAVDPRHARARAARERLRLYKELSDEESRLSELIEHFGWDVASRAPACRRWFFGDDPKLPRFLERLGITYEQYAVMHQYLAFHRLDPARPDLFWIYDRVLARLERLGGPGRVSVLDFGGGLGQIAAAFAGEGYRTVMTDALPYNVAFARSLVDNRDLDATIVQARRPDDFYDTAADGEPFGLVIESSALEHVPDVLGATRAITSGLVPGGIFLSTLLGVEPSPDERAFFERDAGDPDIAAQLFDDTLHAWVRERFEVATPPRTTFRLLTRRG
jgi:SAM-dependent methyltransferase